MAGSRLVIPNADPIYQTPGVPSVGSTLTIYNTGTTDLTNIYTDQSLSTPMANPQTSDGGGYFYDQGTTIWIDDTIAVDALLECPNGQSWTYNELTGIPPAQSEGGFAPINSPSFTGAPTAPTPPINDNSNAIATTSFVVSYVASVLAAVRIVPPGQITTFAMLAIPAGYLVCDGTPVSRTTYASLFTAIGITYGSGDGTTTFNLPNLQGYFLRSLDIAGAIDPGRTIGSIQADDNKAHTHDTDLAPLNNLSGSGHGNVASGSTLPQAGSIIRTSNSVGTESRPKNVAMVFAIKT